MIDTTHSALIVITIALVSLLLRFIPFIVFKNEEKTPKWVTYLGNVLPQAIIGMLVVYCLRTVSVTGAPFGAPELIACAAVALLQLWKNNSILSILGGTVLYMVLTQLVF